MTRVQRRETNGEWRRDEEERGWVFETSDKNSYILGAITYLLCSTVLLISGLQSQVPTSFQKKEIVQIREIYLIYMEDKTNHYCRNASKI